MIEKKNINMENYIKNDPNDNIEAIKKNLDFIIARKTRANFETLCFKIDNWLFYINNGFNNESLLYIENKLFEGAIYYEDILDCLTFAAALRNYEFAPVLNVIIQNFEKIHIFFQNKNSSVDISKYFQHRIDSDNLEELYMLVKVIISKEIQKNYRAINFKIDIWEPYSNIKDLNVLRYIRRIIIELNFMDKSLTEKDLNLSRKIHDVGFLYIREGRLTGDKLLEFLSLEENFYVEEQINYITETNKDQQRQLDDHLKTFNYLKDENEALKRRLAYCESKIAELKAENAKLINRITRLNENVLNIKSKFQSMNGRIY